MFALSFCLCFRETLRLGRFQGIFGAMLSLWYAIPVAASIPRLSSLTHLRLLPTSAPFPRCFQLLLKIITEVIWLSPGFPIVPLSQGQRPRYADWNDADWW